jgi:thymidylate synthase (FAD)
MKAENILGDNIGFIELLDKLGSDLTIVNSARVSFGKRKTELDEGDIKLIKYLAKNKHWSPFRHVQFQFHIKAPEIVGRQFYKHIVGSDYTFKDHAWNEISGRYVVYEEEFYVPPRWRKQSKDNKQASVDEEVDNPINTGSLYLDALSHSYKAYRMLIEVYGLSKEQARGVLPVSFYTEWYWTASLQAVMNFIKLRDHSHAQWEIRQYAVAMRDMVDSVVPHAFAALSEGM